MRMRRLASLAISSLAISLATAKHDSDGVFHVARADSEERVMAELAEAVGIDAKPSAGA